MVRLSQQLNIRSNWLAKLSGWALALALIALALPSLTSSAAFSPYVNYQGKLTDSGGTAVADGSYNLKFRLCQDSACASSLWSETYEGSDKVPVSSGLFSVMLGQLTSLSDIDFNQTLYLEVQVGGSGAPSYETLLPRKILGAVPNAFNARKFDGLATTSFLRSDLANVSATINSLISVNSTSTNSTSTNSTYLGAIAGLNGVYISNWSDLISSGFSTTSADYWFTLQSLGAGFSTTSADYWETTQARWSTTSADYLQTQRNYYSTTSADYWLSAKPLGYFWSTTSADVWGLSKGYITTDVQFSTTSADYWGSTKGYLTSYTETDPIFMLASTSLAYASTSHNHYLSALLEKSYNSLDDLPTLWTSANATTSFNSLIIPYSTQAYNSSTFLSLVDWFATSTQYLTTTTAASTYLTQASSTATYLTIANAASSYFTTTSADYWKSANNFFSTTSADYWFTLQSLGAGFSTTSADYWETTQARWSTTSADYLQTQRNYYSTTSADYWLSAKPLGYFWSTTSADVWGLSKGYITTDVQFSTTSADYWGSTKGYITTDIKFSTTSANYWATTYDGILTAGTTTLTNLSVTNISTSTFAGGLTVGTSQFVVQQSTGRVGIGTANPGTYGGNLVVAASSPQLTVSDNSVQAFISLEQRSNIAYLTRDDGDSLIIGTKTDSSQTSITPQLTVTYDGSVGIGTTSPSGKLHISGGSLYVDNNQQLRFLDSAGSSYASMGLTSGNNLQIVGKTGLSQYSAGTSHAFYTGGANFTSELMRITSDGNVGIGTTTPDGLLTVNSSVTGPQLYLTNSATAPTNVGLRINSPNSSVAATRNWALVANNTAYGDLNLLTSNALGGDPIAAGTSRLYINSSGSVGIGKAAPQATLDVAGTVSSTDLRVNGDATIYGYIYNKGSTNGISFQKTTGYRWWIDDDEAAESLIFSHGTTPGSSVDNILSVNRNGRVGVNTSTPAGTFHVNGSIMGGGNFYPYYYADSGTYLSAATANVLKYYSDSYHSWYIGGSEKLALSSSELYTASGVSLDVAGTVSSTALQVNGNATTTGYLAVGAGAGADSVLEFRKQGAIKWAIGNDVTGDYFSISTSTLGTNNILTISSSTGNITIGNIAASSTSKFSVYINSSVWGGVNPSTGAWMNGSDARLKTNVSDLENPLQKILGLRPVRYNWISDNSATTTGQHLGFIAQEVEGLLPELVSNASGYKALSYAEFSPVIVGAIQQQQAEIDLLKAQLSSSTPVSSGSSSQTTIIVNQASNQFEDLAVSSAATFYGTITVIGEAGFESKVTFKEEVEFQGHITASQDTAGTAVIAAGATSTRISFVRPYASVPRIVANLQSSGTAIWLMYLIADKTTSSFDIILQQAAPVDLYFDWIALSAKDGVGLVAGATETAIPGCTDPIANNFQLSATSDDGSCQYDAPTGGSAGSGSAGDEPPAAEEDSAEEDASPTSSLSGGSETDAETGAGVSDMPDLPDAVGIISGCTNQTAANYNPLATSDDGSCELPAAVIESNQETVPIETDSSAP